MTSPYTGIPIEAWHQKTRELIVRHPLSTSELYEIVLQIWSDIFESKIGRKPFYIGSDLFPSPQIMGFFLHELIALELEQRYPGIWRGDHSTDEKDLVYVPDQNFSIEVKTSSSTRSIYGNRSYAQESSMRGSKKVKSGYYLAINFQKFDLSGVGVRPAINLVRFGWLDHEDWQGQVAATGQQARLSPDVERYKLLKLPLDE